MARKIGTRLILQQLAAGTSRNAIARSLGVSKHSIQAVAEAAGREKVSWRDAEGMEGGRALFEALPGEDRCSRMRLSRSWLGCDPQGAQEDRRDAQAAARRVCRRPEGRRQAMDVL